MKANLIDLGI